MKRVCVFCGSSIGARPVYAQMARAMGKALAQRGLELVYGGSHRGLMGEVAAGAMAAGGHVIGVIPAPLVAKEVAHLGIPDLRIVGSMHERKALMAELADAFVALPGGTGTLEELCEIITWAQIGLHQKPCALLNIEGYFDGLLALLDHAVTERFLRPEHRELVQVAVTLPTLFTLLTDHHPVLQEKWIEQDQT